MPFVKKYNDTLTKFDPPAPVLEILLGSPGATIFHSTSVEALLDSGADITVIPKKLVDQLQLKLVDQLPAIGYEGGSSEKLADVYSVKISIRDVGDYIVKVISSDHDYAFIGRDIVNSWDLLLHGKANVFEIS